MNHEIRFSEQFLKKGLKRAINNIILDIEHLNNVKCVGYMNTILTKENTGPEVRVINTHYDEKFNHSKDLILKSFFRSFSDCIITRDKYLSKYYNNSLFSDSSNSIHMKKAFRNITLNKNNRKDVMILAKNPPFNFFKANEMFKVSQFLFNNFLFERINIFIFRFLIKKIYVLRKKY